MNMMSHGRAGVTGLLLLGLLGAVLPAGATDDLPVVEVRPQSVEAGFAAEAVVEATRQATVGAQVAGRVLMAMVDAGDTVRAGQLLMRLDAREAAEAARAAEAVYGNARAHYERQQQLKAQKFVSQAVVDKARADLEAAVAQRLAAGAAQSHAAIVAPMDGVVTRRHAEAGDLVMPGAPLLTIYQPGGLRAVASVPQGRLREVSGARGALVAFPELGLQVMATALQVLPAADRATHTSQARVSLPAVASVVPGMAARVRFLTGQADKLSVPAAAIVRRGEVTAVYVLAPDGRLALRQLRLGEAVAAGQIEVLAGLAAGEKVVTDPVRAVIRLKSPPNPVR